MWWKPFGDLIFKTFPVWFLFTIIPLKTHMSKWRPWRVGGFIPDVCGRKQMPMYLLWKVKGGMANQVPLLGTSQACHKLQKAKNGLYSKRQVSNQESPCLLYWEWSCILKPLVSGRRGSARHHTASSAHTRGHSMSLSPCPHDHNAVVGPLTPGF